MPEEAVSQSKPKKSCFTIIPFDDDKFGDVQKIIEEVTEDLNLEFQRGDSRKDPGVILSQIETGIRRASVVVADISDQNSNVFYELGMAHQIKGCERVIILAGPDSPEIPYNVHSFRVLTYQDTDEGGTELRENLTEYMKSALVSGTQSERWSVIPDKLNRTRAISKDLSLFTEGEGKWEGAEPVIRTISGLTSLSISEHETENRNPGKGSYVEALLREVAALRNALCKGVQMKALINPPRHHIQNIDRLLKRYDRMIDLLASNKSDIECSEEDAVKDLEAIKNSFIKFHLTPMPNLIIIGDVVAYEGIKRGGARGFEMTHCETDPDMVKKLINDFDKLFDKRQELTNSDLACHLRKFRKDALANDF